VLDLVDKAQAIIANIGPSPLADPVLPSIAVPNANYKETGVFYGAQQIRIRSRYPLDTATDDNLDDSTSCNKYFADIRKKSGGVSVAWCQHGICVGFHMIPKAEGRNDVFSAIYTRWDVAPKLVVYDFACQLHTYCMRREPNYWMNTLFAVDAFHYSKGHKRCSEAYNFRFISDVVPMYTSVRDTSAEVGNSGLKGIRKSLRYMGQHRAMSFIRLRMEIMNRMKIQKLRQREW